MIPVSIWGKIQKVREKFVVRNRAMFLALETQLKNFVTLVATLTEHHVGEVYTLKSGKRQSLNEEVQHGFLKWSFKVVR